MRWLLAILLLLNLGYFAWQQLMPYPPEDAASLRINAANKSDRMTAQQCIYLGRFTQPAARSVRQRLASLDIDASIASFNVTVGGDYWVYVSPFSAKEAALRALRELAAVQLEGYVIAEGDLRNGLSLGTYSSHEQAQQIVEAATRIGMRTQMRITPRVQTEYWLRIEKGSERLVDESLTKRLKNDFSELIQQLKSC